MNRNEHLKTLMTALTRCVCWQWLFTVAHPKCVLLPAGLPAQVPRVRVELTLMKSPLWFLFYRIAAGVGVRALIRREQRDGKWIFNFRTMRDRWGRTLALAELCCRLKGDERWCEKLKVRGGIMSGPCSDLFFFLEGGNGRRSVMWHTGWH